MDVVCPKASEFHFVEHFERFDVPDDCIAATRQVLVLIVPISGRHIVNSARRTLSKTRAAVKHSAHYFRSLLDILIAIHLWSSTEEIDNTISDSSNFSAVESGCSLCLNKNKRSL